jgi:hypothetical protein
MNLLPILYTPKSRYTSDTNVWVPIIVTGIRIGAITMLEWLSLRFVEGAPIGVCVATGVFAVAVLAVLQTKDWLDFKGRWYFTISLTGLLAAWIAVSAYGFLAYPPQDKIIPTFPTADEIGAAIVRNLPKPPVSQPAGSATPAAQVDKRKNPLNDATAKWLLTANLHDLASPHFNLPKCKILIVRYQLPYAEDFSDDLKTVLKVMDWPFEESFASAQLPRGLSVAGLDQGESFRCAHAISEQALRNAASWRGGTWSIPETFIPMNSPEADTLKKCGDCILVNIGNDPDQ